MNGEGDHAQDQGLAVRKQYYFRRTDGGLLAWDVDRLIRLTADLPIREIPLTQIRELDESFFGEEEPPTWRSVLMHLRLIDEAALSYPIILAANGAVMDGMHRVAKAVHQGRHTISAVQFAVDPEPDYVNRGADELPY